MKNTDLSQSQPVSGPSAPVGSAEPSGAISWDDAPLGVTLWAVYGPDSFPTVFACRMKDYFWHGRAIWGFSVYRRKPGFRTLGTGKAWADNSALRLFTSRDAAFAHVASLFSGAAA